MLAVTYHVMKPHFDWQYKICQTSLDTGCGPKCLLIGNVNSPQGNK